MTEWVYMRVGEGTSHEVKSEVEIREREVGENEVYKLINKLNME